MLKDIQDSGRVDAAIRKAQKLEPSDAEVEAANELARQNAADSPHGILKNSEGLLKPSVHAKILSRLFWPQLHDESFRVPKVIADLQSAYETGFEVIKTSRKLTWLHALGQATVELELTDRMIMEEVHTWQATVIWAFQSSGGDDAAQRRSVHELVEHLEMDETLVRSALKFWVNKIVLQEVEKDVFEVLETLNQEDRARSNAQAAASAAAALEDSSDEAALSSHGNITKENREIYWKFVEGMLKNASSQMPLQQIGMMLKMLVPDGFPHSNEELQELLGRKVGSGDLEFVGGKYRLKK
jgi:anaphase-promoting complex subunit 2